jgi:acyl carrier protein
VRRLGRLLGQEKSGETMDARAAPFDANKIRVLIAKYLGIDAERVTDETHFRNDFDLDSLEQLELLILLEEEFSSVEFSDAAVEQIEVVGDLIRYTETYSLHFAGRRPDVETNGRYPISAGPYPA